MLVRNGDGRGTDEVRSYEIFLNGERAVPADHSRDAQAAVKLQSSNTLKVTLMGSPIQDFCSDRLRPTRAEVNGALL
jgi:hypothetical protein